MGGGIETPVVFFVFNRPELTARTFAAIREAAPKKLLVVADGPRADVAGEAKRTAAARNVVDYGVDWDCEVLKNYSGPNIGIRARFASAFRWVFEQVEEAIILEEDCFPDPSFFQFCETLLERYRDNPRVMWIGGTNPLERKYGDGSYYFSRCNWIWGWATWRRAWRHYDIDLKGLEQFKASGQIERITPYKRMRDGFMDVFEQARNERFQNWDAQSTFNIWSHDGLSIIPNGNLISNIGFSEAATNTTSPRDPLANLRFRPLKEIVHPTEIRVYPKHDLYVFDTYCKHLHRESALVRARRRLRNEVLMILPYRKALKRLYRSWRG